MAENNNIIAATAYPDLLCGSLSVDMDTTATSLMCTSPMIINGITATGEIVCNNDYDACDPIDAGIGLICSAGKDGKIVGAVVNIAWDGSQMNFWVDDMLVAYFNTTG